jgi:translocation and assembly module TamA
MPAAGHQGGRTTASSPTRARGRRAAAALAVAASALVACGDRDEDPLARAAAEVRTGTPVPYEVEIQGVGDEELADFLRDVSETAAADEPAPSMIALRRRVLADENRLRRALGGEGYYDARVEGTVTETDDEAGVIFEIDLGPRYTLAGVDIRVLGEAPDYEPPAPAELGLELGAPAVAQRIIDAEQTLLTRAQVAGRAYAELGERRAVIDREAKTLTATLAVRPGPVVRLGEVDYTGVEGIDDDFLRARLPFEPGARYSPELVRETRRELVASGLFRTVQVELPETPPPDDTVPVTIAAEQRLHRTIGVGVRFETDGGPGVSAEWEHRNAFGGAERVEVALDADLLEQSLGAGVRTPDFYGRSRSLLGEAEILRQTTDAFDSLVFDAALGVEQRFSEELTGTVGVGFEVSEITEAGETENFGLVFLPTTLRFDNTESPLDPERGVRARAEYTPFWDLLSPGLFFQRVELSASTYFKLAESPRLVLAVRGRVGSITGAPRDSIPANRRFYAGGGGSIRGIPFQTASPLDEDDDPIGGRSLLETAVELRYNITETIGVVAFVDAGRAFEASYPDFSEPLIVGAGLGARYFTPIGPLRVDIAVPVDRRDVDDVLQVYVSLGQAF